MKKGLVSIITPCYNSGKYIGRYINSVLNQSYSQLELILVNDGSTDETENIIFSYMNKIKSADIDLKYIKQENEGIAAAINRGLQIFNGEFITWPDSDDILHKNYIKNKVEYLQEKRSYSLVISKIEVVDEHNLKKRIDVYERVHNSIECDNMFEDLIYWRNLVILPGAFMARSKDFLNVVGRHIHL